MKIEVKSGNAFTLKKDLATLIENYRTFREDSERPKAITAISILTNFSGLTIFSGAEQGGVRDGAAQAMVQPKRFRP
jgi:hypothetical protein